MHKVICIKTGSCFFSGTYENCEAYIRKYARLGPWRIE